jgi:hypothetical protein
MLVYVGEGGGGVGLRLLCPHGGVRLPTLRAEVRWGTGPGVSEGGGQLGVGWEGAGRGGTCFWNTLRGTSRCVGAGASQLPLPTC